ncbi:MAG TPA: hypothetical protein VHX38_41285 [Pseudonocardiaceae bacterium]|nr:hypothetical protein [Pseudonocardiaceae bacterium]
MRHAFARADRRGQPITGADARAVATVLAIFLDPDSEMARFADTGDANPVLLSQECQTARRLTEHLPGASEWIIRFEQYLAARSDLGRQPQPPRSSESAGHIEHSGHDDLAAEGLEALVFGDELDVVRAYLNMTFARADARGESISEDSARLLAKLLAAILGPDSAMKRFAETGEGDLRDLQQECRQLTGQQWPTADIVAWAHRFEQYLASSPQPPTPGAPTERDNPQIAQGIGERRQALPPAVADALARTEQEGLSEQPARDIARFLADHPAATAGALRDYGVAGTLAHDKVIRELFDVYVAGNDQHHQLVRALGSHLIWQGIEAEMLQGVTEPDSAPRLHAMFDPANFRVVLGLEAHGHAFVAYLQLHDVDPHDDGLLRGFQDVYLGSYSTYSELLQAFRIMLVDAGEWDDRDPAVLDDVTLMQFARRAWDIVEVGDRFYVFHK